MDASIELKLTSVSHFWNLSFGSGNRAVIAPPASKKAISEAAFKASKHNDFNVFMPNQTQHQQLWYERNEMEMKRLTG